MLTFALLAGGAAAAPPGVRHVRADAAPGGDGLTWPTAYNDLNAALSSAASSGGSINELWVKEGTYLPGPAGSTDKTVTFTLIDNVGVYGGFAGAETARDQRDPAAHVTTLSGRLTISRKVYHVVVAAGHDCVLDGFTVTGGSADPQGSSDPAQQTGAGIRITGTPTIRNCIITGNDLGEQVATIDRAGAGIYCAPGSAATIVDCTISNNLGNFAMITRAGWGAGLAAEGCSVTLLRCRILNNATNRGGNFGCMGGFPSAMSAPSGPGAGLGFESASALVQDCVIAGNVAGKGPAGISCRFDYEEPSVGGDGGGVYVRDSAVVIVNTLLRDNRTGDGGDGFLYAPFGTPIGAVGGSDGGNGAGAWTSGGAVEFVNCTFADNAVGQGGTAPSGAQPGVPGAGAAVFGDASTRLQNCIIWDGGLREIIGAVLVSYSDVQGGYPGTGNINADPRFIDPSAGDFRLGDSSPCIDAGHSSPSGAILPAADADGLTRRVDIASVPDTGLGAPVVDMGPYEFQNPCVADLNGDGLVDFSDYLEFLNLFDAGDLRVDFNHDGLIDFGDYLEFLNLYEVGC